MTAGTASSKPPRKKKIIRMHSSKDASVGVDRKVFFQRRCWDKEFREWLEVFEPVVADALPVVDREDKFNGKPAEYAAHGKCSRCRRLTRGYSSKVTKRRLSPYVIYPCKCERVGVKHCLRCVCLEYILEARKNYDDVCIRRDGKVVGIREIPCIGKCGETWSLASLMMIGPPCATERDRVIKIRRQASLEATAARKREQQRQQLELEKKQPTEVAPFDVEEGGKKA